MNTIVKIFLSMSLSGSLLILLLFLCKYLWKNKISRQWQYYIWLLVIARLLLPFTPENSLSGSFFQTIERTITENSNDSTLNSGSDAIRNPVVFDKASTINASRKPSPAESLCFLWLIAALLLFVRKVTLYQSFVQYLKAGQIPVSDTNLLDQLAILGEEIGIKGNVELFVNPLISSPLLIGFFKPSIILPDVTLSDSDFRYTVLHELIHYRRHDMFYKWLVQITLCLHWFNPLVYVMSREINQACEFSCDEAVLGKIGSCHARAYGETLLRAMTNSGHYREALASVTLNENKKTLKERLGAIMNFTKKSKIAVISTITLTLLLGTGAAFLGAYVSPSEKAPDVLPAASALPAVAPAASASPANEPLSETISEVSSISPEDADKKALFIMENSGTWGESIERLLPAMSAKAIEEMLLIYIERHIFAGISTADDIKAVKETIHTAYTYLPNNTVQKIEDYIETLE